MTKFSASTSAIAMLACSGFIFSAHTGAPDAGSADVVDPVLASRTAQPPSGDTTVHSDVAADTVEIAVSLTPELRVLGDDDEVETVRSAIDRFTSNQLELPDLEVRFLDDEDGCGGHDGLFQRRTTPWRVLVCSDLAYVVTHELAHAWEAANVDDHTREMFVSHRGLPAWDGSDYDWMDRGVEIAAFIVQQNLMIRCADLDSPEWTQRAAAFELLTGMQSPLAACA